MNDIMLECWNIYEMKYIKWEGKSVEAKIQKMTIIKKFSICMAYIIISVWCENFQNYTMSLYTSPSMGNTYIFLEDETDSNIVTAPRV